MLKLNLQYFGIDVKSWLIWKDPDAGKDWKREKGTTEDEMVGWYHQLYEHEFEWTPGVGDGQGGLVCCRPWGCRVRHDWVTELNWTDWSLMKVSTFSIVYWLFGFSFLWNIDSKILPIFLQSCPFAFVEVTFTFCILTLCWFYMLPVTLPSLSLYFTHFMIQLIEQMFFF